MIEHFVLCVMVSESGNGLASEEKKLLLERYGLNPDEFLSEPSPPKVPSRTSPHIRSLVCWLRKSKEGRKIEY